MIKRLIGFGVIPIASLYLAFFSDLAPGRPEIAYTLAIAVLMAGWWITEIIPLAITALLPVVLFPVFGVMDGKAVSSAYFNHVIFLFIGGFIMALAMQKWDLHRRIALKIMMVTGSSPKQVLLGFMLSTAFLSMWISNTATAMMMVPIVMSVTKKLADFLDTATLKRYSVGLLLAVAYSASVGGIATLVGTPPNLSFARILQIMFPTAPEISFGSWFLFALPVSLIMLGFIWLLLTSIYQPKGFDAMKANEAIRSEYKRLGKKTQEEKIILVLFTSLALLWLTRANLGFGSFTIPGWSNLLPYPDYLNDGTVAIAIAVLLFLIPSSESKGKRLMDWETASGLPWNIVLLFGGGFALAGAFKSSGLSLWIGELMSETHGMPILVIIAIIAFSMTFLTELTSNTATTEMALPILAGLAVSMEINPLLLMLPATMSASMAFMLPVATPPNAIVFGSNQITVAQMAGTGLLLNLVGVVIVTLSTYFWGAWVFDIDVTLLPHWATFSTH